MIVGIGPLLEVHSLTVTIELRSRSTAGQISKCEEAEKLKRLIFSSRYINILSQHHVHFIYIVTHKIIALNH